MAIMHAAHKRPWDGQICGYSTRRGACYKCGWRLGAVDLSEYQRETFDRLERAYAGEHGSFTVDQHDAVAYAVWMLVLPDGGES